MIEQLKEWDCA